jgi:hypothetical protein
MRNVLREAGSFGRICRALWVDRRKMSGQGADANLKGIVAEYLGYVSSTFIDPRWSLEHPNDAADVGRVREG